MTKIEKVIEGLRICFYQKNCDGCPYEEDSLKAVGRRHLDDWHCPVVDDALELLKDRNHPDCEHAEHDGAGCLGYSGSHDDEPIDACKNCKKYTGNVTKGDFI